MEEDMEPDVDEAEPCVSKKRQRGKPRSWIKDRDFGTQQLALEFVNLENCWAIQTGFNTKDGQKVFYRCNKVGRRQLQCPAALYLLYHSNQGSGVSLFRTESDHDHEGRDHSRGLHPNTRRAVLEIYDQGITTPLRVLSELYKRGLPRPTKRQLTNFLWSYKHKNLEQRADDSEIDDWCAPTPHAAKKVYVVPTHHHDETLNSGDNRHFFVSNSIPGTSHPQRHCPTCRCYK